jgi:hypothetical protein
MTNVHIVDVNLDVNSLVYVVSLTLLLGFIVSILCTAIVEDVSGLWYQPPAEISKEEYLALRRAVNKVARDDPQFGLERIHELIANTDRFIKDSWRASLIKLIRKARVRYLQFVIDHNVKSYLRDWKMPRKEIYYTILNHINFVGQVIFPVTPYARRQLEVYLRNTIKTTAQTMKVETIKA